MKESAYPDAVSSANGQGSASRRRHYKNFRAAKYSEIKIQLLEVDGTTMALYETSRYSINKNIPDLMPKKYNCHLCSSSDAILGYRVEDRYA